MLTTKRRVGERIYLTTPAGEVTILVLSIGAERVRLGIEAPREVVIGIETAKEPNQE